jgi:radical SAM superfamily enzyme YgiQ (UPF0313 family)
MNSARILLISGNKLRHPYPVYPLGISYIASYLRKQLPQISVDLFDCNLASNEELEQILTTRNYLAIGISMRNVDNVNFLDEENYVHFYRQLIDLCRAGSAAPIVLGGAGFSIFPELLMSRLAPDFGIQGEGEYAFSSLVQCLLEKRDPSEIAGLLVPQAEGIRVNPRGSFREDLCLEFEPELLVYYWRHSGMLNIQTKRGCPFQCDFCSYPLIEGRNVRTLDAELVVETLARLKQDHGIDYVFFTDSVFNIAPSYNQRLAELLIKRQTGVRWGAFFSPRTMSRQDLLLLKQSGLTHMELGTDSLSEAMLGNYRKAFSVAEVLALSNLCHELSVHFAHFLILGGFGETPQTLRETFDNAERLPPTVLFPAVGTRIYPGTGVARRALMDGSIQSEEELLQSRYYLSPAIDADQLKAQFSSSSHRWVFMDEDLAPGMNRMRQKGYKGPLWEYIVR